MELEAIRYCYIPSQEIGLAGVVVKPTPALLGLQAALIEAVAPFTKTSGEHFNPHVSTGVATRKDLDQMLAEPFESFGFAFSGAAAIRSAIPERA